MQNEKIVMRCLNSISIPVISRIEIRYDKLKSFTIHIYSTLPVHVE